MKQYLKDVVKYKYMKKLMEKKEKKIKILKSIVQNKKVKNILRAYLKTKIIFYYKHTYPNKHKKICFLTGRKRGVVKFLNLSRHTTKKLNILGRINNITRASW